MQLGFTRLLLLNTVANLSAKTYFLSYSTSKFATSASLKETQPANSHEALISLTSRASSEDAKFDSSDSKTAKTLSASVAPLLTAPSSYLSAN
jgi:hypothetical protein